MIEVDSPYPPGRVAVATGGVVREPLFFYSFEGLHVPRGTRIAGQDSAYLHENRNGCIAQMMNDASMQWIVFVDDDNVFPQDMILRLLSHEKPVVGSLYVNKQYPWIPHVYNYEPTENGAVLFKNHALATLPKEGLLEVDGLATSGLLIRREVLNTLPAKPFDIRDLGDDLGFCHKVKQQGFPIYVDTSIRLGHVAHVPLFPHVNESGEWCIGAQVSSREFIEIG